MMYHWDNLEEEKTKQKFGVLYENLNLKSGRGVILIPLTYLLRRLLLAYIVIYPHNLIFQYIIMMLTIIFQITIVGMIEPFNTRYEHRMTLANEAFVMCVLYVYLCFSDFVQTPEDKYTMGFACIVVVGLHMLFNFGIIMLVNLQECRNMAKKKRRD